jgi:Tfp pilus assembly protein PilX
MQHACCSDTLPKTRRGRQRGVSLIVVMVLILVAAAGIVASLQLSRSQYQLVGNLQYLEQAFNRAESTVKEGENWLITGSNSQASGFTLYASSVDTGSPGLYPRGQLAGFNRDPASMEWDVSNSAAANDGRYLIEVIARGKGTPNNSMELDAFAGGSDSGQTRNCKVVDIFRLVGKSTAVRGAARTIETTYAFPGLCQS